MTKFALLLVTLLVILSLALSSPSKHDKDKKDDKSHHEKKHKKQENASAAHEELDEIPDEGWDFENTTAVDNRRILYSKKTEKAKRPYMVYLQLTKESAKAHKYPGWLCGGVIVDHYYVMTSAACVEDADKFYIVSGTTKFVDSLDYKSDNCVCKHRRRVVWKCIPKNYKFDFQDSIKWSSNDIAIVKVDRAFKFGVTESGCEFATCPIAYNNISRELEKPGTKGWIAGWGSGSNFREGVYRRQKSQAPRNARCLQEAKVCIMDNEQCAKKWAQRFREIITQYMICTRDVMKRLSEVCDKRYANCSDMDTRRDEHVEVPAGSISIDLGRHLRDPDDYTARRSMPGGFCENDHGGPLIVRYKNKETLVGIISACKIDPKTHSCHGPFLYTSVYKNCQFISCAIHKEVADCRRVFRSGITHEEWTVSWDDVEEDDDDDDDAGNVRASDESAESKDILRQSTDAEKKDKKSKKSKKDDDSSSEEDDKSTTERPEKKKDTKKEESEKADKHKKKSKSKKHKGRGDDKAEKLKKNKGSVEEASPKGKPDPVSYESSNDENVNNPDKE